MILDPQHQRKGDIDHHSNEGNYAHDFPIHCLCNFCAYDVRQESSDAFYFKENTADCKAGLN